MPWGAARVLGKRRDAVARNGAQDITTGVDCPGARRAGFGMTRGTILGSQHHRLSQLQAAAQPHDAAADGAAQPPPPPRTEEEPPRVCVGLGRMAMSRVEMFRAEAGVAVVMEKPVFRVPSVAGERALQQG